MTFAQVVKAGGYCGWRVPGWEQKPTGLKDGLVGWSRTNNVLDDVWWALICTFPLMRGWENLQNSQMTSNMTFSPVFPFVLLLLHLVFGFGDGSGRTKENVWEKRSVWLVLVPYWKSDCFLTFEWFWARDEVRKDKYWWKKYWPQSPQHCFDWCLQPQPQTIL